MVDFSHGNSRKQFKLQMEVCDSVAAQMAGGEERIVGVMVESHLVEGRQDLSPDKALTYGQSVTDACINWDDSLTVLDRLAAGVRARRVAGWKGRRPGRGCHRQRQGRRSSRCRLRHWCRNPGRAAGRPSSRPSCARRAKGRARRRGGRCRCGIW
jgi:hypothetical protein